MKFTKQQKKDYFNYLELFKRGLLTEKIFNQLIINLEQKQVKINKLNDSLCYKCNNKFTHLLIDNVLFKKSYCRKCYIEAQQEKEIKIFKFKNNIE